MNVYAKIKRYKHVNGRATYKIDCTLEGNQMNVYVLTWTSNAIPTTTVGTLYFASLEAAQLYVRTVNGYNWHRIISSSPTWVGHDDQCRYMIQECEVQS